jgi:hypothetical protein
VAQGCADASACDDRDPCTSDTCVAGACVNDLPPGLGSARCVLQRLVDAPLCPETPPRRRLARAITRRVAGAVRLLGAAAETGPERPAGRRKIAAALKQLRRAERRTTTATENGRLAPECGAAVLGALGRTRGALTPADAVQPAPPSRTASW